MQARNHWDYLYMYAQRLQIEDIKDFSEFFGMDVPNSFYRQKDIDKALELKLDEYNEIDELSELIDFYKHLSTVIDLKKIKDSSVVDLYKSIFNLIGFNRNKDIYIYGPTKIEYILSGQRAETNPDIVIQNRNLISLVVHEDKSYRSVEDDYHWEAEPQLVAEIIAAFYKNSQVMKGGLEAQTIYGIVILGSYCTFYKFNMCKTILSRISNFARNEKININKIYRYVIGESDPKFMTNRENLHKTLLCYEALRIIILEKN